MFYRQFSWGSTPRFQAFVLCIKKLRIGSNPVTPTSHSTCLACLSLPVRVPVRSRQGGEGNLQRPRPEAGVRPPPDAVNPLTCS